MQEIKTEVQEVETYRGFIGKSYNSVDIGMPWPAIINN